MSKCGKFIPECEYFGTGGCISPFNCPYKMESEYSNSATSVPEYVYRGNNMTEKEIESCLERFATCKVTDVMNFDYAGTIAYIERLKSENAALQERIENAVKRLKAREQSVYCGLGEWKAVVTDKDIDEVFGVTESSLEEPEGGKE